MTATSELLIVELSSVRLATLHATMLYFDLDALPTERARELMTALVREIEAKGKMSEPVVVRHGLESPMVKKKGVAR